MLLNALLKTYVPERLNFLFVVFLQVIARPTWAHGLDYNADERFPKISSENKL